MACSNSAAFRKDSVRALTFPQIVVQQLTEDCRSIDRLIGLQTQEELDPMKDWLKIIQNYIVFDEVIPPTPERKRRKLKKEEM